MTRRKTEITAPEIETITRGFSDLSLPASDWTHEAHLITGLSLVIDNGLEQAQKMMPNMIRSFNEAKGGVNSDTEGYHHTITIYYLRILEEFRKSHPNLEETELVNLMLQNPIAEKMYLLRSYSKERLFSKDARLFYVPPDL